MARPLGKALKNRHIATAESMANCTKYRHIDKATWQSQRGSNHKNESLNLLLPLLNHAKRVTFVSSVYSAPSMSLALPGKGFFPRKGDKLMPTQTR